MEEQQQQEQVPVLTFYQKYKDSVKRSYKKWLSDENNRKKFKEDNQYRLQLYKYSYYKLKDLMKDGRFTNDEMTSLQEEVKQHCNKLKQKKAVEV